MIKNVSMLGTVKLQNELKKRRKEELKSQDVLQWVTSVLHTVDQQHLKISEHLNTSKASQRENDFTLSKLDANRIFHLSQIKRICIQYRLKFLNTTYFKGTYPAETISKINELERVHSIEIKGFKIVAPSILFKLNKADDPLLFAPIGNNLYYLIDSWGNDLNKTRKVIFWPVRTFDHFAFTILLSTFIATIACHRLFFGDEGTVAHFFIVFLFFLKGIIGMAIFYGIASGKNFSMYSWNSKFDKIQ